MSNYHHWYKFIDVDFADRTKTNIGFTNLIALAPYQMDEQTLEGFRARNAHIREFHKITRDVFMASLRGDADPAIAELIVAEQPPCRGRAYHHSLTEQHLRLPIFFRTDEPAPGAIAEIQCPASGWEITEQTWRLYQEYSKDFGRPKHFSSSLLTQLAQAIRDHVGKEPVIHHLSGNASRPHGVAYTIQRLREEGIRHFAWDPVQSTHCNFIRGHEFYDLRYNGFFDQWIEACTDNRLLFDHPPTPLYDAKVIMAWPFWAKTRDFYPEECRKLFPHTDILTQDGFHLADGTWVNPEEYCNIGQSKRDYYFKFGSHHPTLNWGSRGVFYSGSLTVKASRRLFDRMLTDTSCGYPWIVQQACTHPEVATAVSRNGEEIKIDAYTKFSGFYEPRGLLAVMVMQAHSSKVHGSPRTILSSVY